MTRFLMAAGLVLCALALAHGQDTVAPASKGPAADVKFDWYEWQRLPLLDDGRIKPLDTLADETVTLVTGRSKWTDPETKREYRAPELLYAWITSPDEWLSKPILRCEFRPLRELLDTDKTDVPREGTFVSLRDVLDWESSRAQGKPVYWSAELETRLNEIDRASRQKRNPDTVGETSADRALNGKIAELFSHLQAFIAAREARNVLIVPGLDPRVLTKQTNPDENIPAWVSLGSILRMDDWTRDADVTVSAVMAPDHRALLDHLLMAKAYPPEHLPQLAQAQKVKDGLQVHFRDVQAALRHSKSAYDAGKVGEFDSAMATFSREVRRLAEAMEQARPKMTPPEPKSLDFGEWNDDMWRLYKPLELGERQMSFSAYPAADATKLEITYNKFQPFRSAWIFFLAATIVVVLSAMVKTPRPVYLLGLLVTLGAVAYSTWGFILRIAIAGRPPVTNMYETVIWVSFVVAVMGLWFCLLPLTWPGLRWSWRLSGMPFRAMRNEQGQFRGIEVDRLNDEDRDATLAAAHLPIQFVLSAIRLAGFIGIVWFLTSSNTSFEIIDLRPPIFGLGGSTASFGTWCVGMTTVLLSAWYLPRVAITLALFPFFAFPEARRERGRLWEQAYSRRYFLFGALPVACLGMMLAHFVGVASPEILNPRIGSITAVLRDNYWLTIHVLTIVSSYAAGALAWGLGNLAMLYYLGGRYRTESGQVPTHLADKEEFGPAFDPQGGDTADTIGSRLRTAGRALKPGVIGKTLKAGFQDFGSGDEHLDSRAVRPPKEVATLATYGYKSSQVAVLLLAAGTILGGLWADVSWGRFWDWDPKEVWALISLLAYLIVLHGRFAGWVGTFGTNVGNVACFSAILMSWYGVNFVLPQIHGWLNGTGQATEVGLHSYATGAGGLEYVVTAVALNALLVLAALGRYVAETTDLFNRSRAAEAPSGGKLGRAGIDPV